FYIARCAITIMLSLVLQVPGVPAAARSRPGNPTAPLPTPTARTQSELSGPEKLATWQTRSGLYSFNRVVKNVAQALEDESDTNLPVAEQYQQRRSPRRNLRYSE